MDANELRKELADAFRDLKDGKLKAREAKAMAALAGQMIESAKVQVLYHAARRQPPAIPFLESRNPSQHRSYIALRMMASRHEHQARQP